MARTRILAVAGGLIAGLALVVPAPAADTTAAPRQLYVATDGRDRWPGTIDRPFATVSRAQQAVRSLTASMRSDIVVNVRGGTYRLSGTLELSADAGDSGRNGYRVVYRSYGYGGPKEERVTLSGGRQISGWRRDPVRPGVWRADVGELETRQVYVDGVRAKRAALGEGLPGTMERTPWGYRVDTAAPQAWHDHEDIEFVYRFPIYAEARCGVASITGDADHSDIRMEEPCWSMALAMYEEPLPGEEPEPLGGPSDVENSGSFLGAPGGWYVDRSRYSRHVLYYVPRPGQDMSRVEVVAPVLQTLVSGTGRPDAPLHDVTFQGLTFAHATWLAPSEPGGFVNAWSMYKRPDVSTWLTVPGNVAFRSADRITFAGNRFVHLGAQALEISKSSSDNVVQGNLFTDVSDGAVLVGVTLPDTAGTNRGNKIINNWIHHIGVEYHAAAGIWNPGSQDTVISHNQVNDVPYNGILSGRDPDAAGATRGLWITGNRVFNTLQVMGDGGGIYLRGKQGTSFTDGAVLSGNVVTGGRLDQEAFFAAAAYTDDSSKWVTVDRNVLYGYLASIGGCDESPDRPVKNLRYTGNFWDDAVPEWIERRPFPGAWPCGDPHQVTFTGNTVLTQSNPRAACANRPQCAAIVNNAGVTAPWRSRLQMPRAARTGRQFQIR